MLLARRFLAHHGKVYRAASSMPRLSYHVHKEGKVPVGIMKLDDGKMNSFDFELLKECSEALDKAANDESTALVITGNAKALSAGFDLKVMNQGNPHSTELVEQGGRLCIQMFSFPKPLVMAATGHGLALGAILLLAADVRIGHSGSKAKYGMNETAIGMVVPAFGWRLAQYRLKSHEFTRALTQGTIYDVKGAHSVGYLDELTDGDVFAAALTEAQRLGGYVKQPAFANMKREERGDLIDSVLSNIHENVTKCFADYKPSKL